MLLWRNNLRMSSSSDLYPSDLDIFVPEDLNTDSSYASSKTRHSRSDISSKVPQYNTNADPKTKKLIQFNKSELEVPGLGTLKLYQLVTQPFFQGNTLIFDKLLMNDDKFVICVFPPG